MREIHTGLIARIEGHGKVSIVLRGDVLENVKMQVVEGSRFFETLIKGRPWYEVPTILMRICSICTADHNLAAVRAVENAFEVEVSEQTRLLRELLMHGSILESHFLHIFFLSLPDLLGFPSALAMKKYYPEELERGFRLKKLGNDVQRVVGGRAIHPEKSKVGGFTSLPTENQLANLKRRIVLALKDALHTVDLILTQDYAEIRDSWGIYSCLMPGRNYDYFGDRILLGERVYEVSRYGEVIVERPISHSTAKRSTTKDGKPIMVGSLARLNLIWDKLPPMAKECYKNSDRFPSYNPMENILAQAIETVASLERCVEIIDELITRGIRNEKRIEIKPKESRGFGAVEAPRGTLYHDIAFDSSGKVKACNIITPTAINTYHMEEILRKEVKVMLSEEKNDEEIKKMSEVIVRAYDPCLSCSAHVIRIKE
ncbi:MAG: Ni/Fe hydrogenase subunit alpha [Thermoplasmata archaeon]|nr:Ni/Fe hydrogenase subunit alpha [Thermoplasmata archaeon]